jgi:hypothetical protein
VTPTFSIVALDAFRFPTTEVERFLEGYGPTLRVIHSLALGRTQWIDAVGGCERVKKRIAFGNNYYVQTIRAKVSGYSKNLFPSWVQEDSIIGLSLVPDNMTPENPNSLSHRHAPGMDSREGFVG